MPVMRFLFLNETQAALVNSGSAPGSGLAPRKIVAGPDMNNFVLPLAVINDDAHMPHRTFFLSLPQRNVDTELAWPEPPEE